MAIDALFINYSSSYWMAKIEAEIYMRVYQYAAEDFRAVSDCKLAHDGVDLWMTATSRAVSSFKDTVVAHTHVGNLGAPTSPPSAPILFIEATNPPGPISTTLASENQDMNYMIASTTLSYTDNTNYGINIAASSFRRAKVIGIAYGTSSLATKEE